LSRRALEQKSVRRGSYGRVGRKLGIGGAVGSLPDRLLAWAACFPFPGQIGLRKSAASHALIDGIGHPRWELPAPRESTASTGTSEARLSISSRTIASCIPSGPVSAWPISVVPPAELAAAKPCPVPAAIFRVSAVACRAASR